MQDAYRWIDGMEDLLTRLARAEYDMHSLSNYPVWHQYIEAKLQLSRYLRWTFISCEGPIKGLRKPSPECFAAVIEHIGRPAGELLLVDDRLENVTAARAAGMMAIHFNDASQLEEELIALGLHGL